jgi:dolichol-phosphate mannosyltransferase
MLGFQKAKHDVLLCMDADLQHEPESVPAVAGPVLGGMAEFSVGSRNVEGGEVPSWSPIRRLISFVATLLAWPLTTCTDPMSGFFCLPRDVLDRGKDACNVAGFKISLELQVRTGAHPIKDVPITFRERVAGESKLTMKQNIEYLEQLMSLFFFKFPKLSISAVVAVLAILYTMVTMALSL